MNACILLGHRIVEKTYFIDKYATKYHKLFGRMVVYITRNEEDDTLKKNEDLYTKILIDKHFPMNLTMKSLKNCLVIMDDIENSNFPEITAYLYRLLDEIIKCGRHYNISIIFSNQQARQYKKTRNILENASLFVFFNPKQKSDQTIAIYKNKIGLSPKDIEHINNIEGRWVAIRRTAPMYVVSQFETYLIGCEYY